MTPELIPTEQVRADQLVKGDIIWVERWLTIEESGRHVGSVSGRSRAIETDSGIRYFEPDAQVLRKAAPLTLTGDPDVGPFDPDELVRWAEMYGHPEYWVGVGKKLHAKCEELEAAAPASPVVTDEMVQRALFVAAKGGELPYMASVSEFNRKEIKEGKLREADRAADERNAMWMRGILEAALASQENTGGGS